MLSGNNNLYVSAMHDRQTDSGLHQQLFYILAANAWFSSVTQL